MVSFKQLVKNEFKRLDEAVFKSDKTARVCNLFGSVIGKSFGGAFVTFDVVDYSKSSESGRGYFMVNPKNKLLKINWTAEDSSKASNANNERMFISSMDYYDDASQGFNKPTTTVTFNVGVNVVKIAQFIAGAIKKGSGKYTFEDIGFSLNESDKTINEASKADLVKFLKDNDVKGKFLYHSGKAELEDFINADDILKQKYDKFLIEVTSGKPETNSLDTEIKQKEKKMETLYSDPKYVFEDIRAMTEFIAKGHSKSLIVSGDAGVGKCLTRDTKVIQPDGSTITMGEIKVGDLVVTPEGDAVKVLNKYEQFDQDCYRVTLSDGRFIDADEDQLFKVKTDSEQIMTLKLIKDSYSNIKIPVYIDDKIEYKVIKSIEYIGKRDTACVEIDSKDHLYLVNDYFIVHNTYHITQVLEKLYGEAGIRSDGWYNHKAIKAAPFAFYKTVFKERFGTVLFDEADSLLTNDDIIMMLKAGLDTSGKCSFEYMAGTNSTHGMSEDEIRDLCKDIDAQLADGKLLGQGQKDKGELVRAPSKFFFDGQIIFITNMPQSKIDSAVLSRSLCVDVHLAARDKRNLIKTIADSDKDLNENEQNDIFKAFNINPDKVQNDGTIKYITPENANEGRELTIRSFTIAKKMMKAGVPNWQRLAALYA